jgi:hypothetical protein
MRVMDPMDATRGRLIARTSRYPLGFDHRSNIKKCLKCHEICQGRFHIKMPQKKKNDIILDDFVKTPGSHCEAQSAVAIS